MWNPPTSSGSHSAKSNGCRFVSAKVAITKRTKASGCFQTIHEPTVGWASAIARRSRLPASTITERIVRISVSS